MNKSLLIFGSLFLTLSLTAFLFFQKILFWGVHHSIYYCQTFFGAVFPQIPRGLDILLIGSALVLAGIVLTRLFLLAGEIGIFQKKILGRVASPDRLETLIEELHLNDKVRLTKAKEPFAFCWGVRSPCIFISTGLVSLMSHKELKAILLHEKYHLEHYDSLTLLIGRVTENLFPFLPIVSDLVDRFRIGREISADGFAIKFLGQREPIISALRKLLLFESQSIAIAPTFMSSDTMEGRILALTGRENIRKINKTRLILSMLIFAALASFVSTPISAEEVHHKHTGGKVMCTSSINRNFSVPASQFLPLTRN